MDREGSSTGAGGRGLGPSRSSPGSPGGWPFGSPGAIDGAWEPQCGSPGAIEGAWEHQCGSPGARDGAWEPQVGSTGAVDGAWEPQLGSPGATEKLQPPRFRKSTTEKHSWSQIFFEVARSIEA